MESSAETGGAFSFIRGSRIRLGLIAKSFCAKLEGRTIADGLACATN
jgi:hypothetical protein